MKASINHIKEKIKGLAEEMYLASIIILVAIISFGLGRLSKIEERKTPIKIIENNITTVAKGLEKKTEQIKPGGYVASKNGSSYYLPWCAGAQKIKDINKIWFDTEMDAKSAGYKPATNCKGLSALD